MSNIDPVTPYLEAYLNRWMTSPTSKRIVSVESAAIASGRVDNWEGVTVPDFWISILQEYTDLLRKNPELLKTAEDIQAERDRFKVALQAYLDKQQKLIDKADALNAKLKSYKLGRLDPRYYATSKELQDVVQQFSIVDENYQFNVNALPKM